MGSFVGLRDSVLGDVNGPEQLYQKEQRKPGTNGLPPNLFNSKKIDSGPLFDLRGTGCQLKSPALVRTSGKGYSRPFPMSTTESETRKLFEEFVGPNYGRYNLVLARGRGSRVWDEAGKEYLDFGAGIAVSTLGHAHPRMIEALEPAGA